MDPATDDDNHDSTDSTSLPANDHKEEKSQKTEKANRLRNKPDIPVMFSDSDDSLEGFGYAPRKRKNDSESEDDWDPRKGPKKGSAKKKPKTEKKEKSPRKPRKPREPKEKKTKRTPKPKKEKDPSKPAKKRGRKPKNKKEEEDEEPIKEEEDSNDGIDDQDPTTEKDTEEETDGNVEANDTKSEESNAAAEDSKPKPSWNAGELLSDMMAVDRRVAENIVRLFENDNTIPFIARYRREMTGDMSPEELRHAKDAYETIKSIQTKAASILKAVSKLGKLTPHLAKCINGARSMDELEHFYAPYKAGSKRTKAEAARQLGLEPAALTLLEGSDYVNLQSLLRPGTPGLHTVTEVEDNVCYIIADVISKDKDVLDELRVLQKRANNIKIESSLSRSAKGSGKEKKATKAPGKFIKPEVNKGLEDGKYEHYYNFSCPIQHVKSHQVLALNRGESQKVLSVKISIPDWFINGLKYFCRNRWLNGGRHYPLRTQVFEKSFKDAFSRLIHPLLARQIRSHLNQEAERAAIEVFATNLKKLLLTPPLKGISILGLDPGFSNGCKAAMVSASGTILDTEVLYINFHKSKPGPPSEDPVAIRLKQLLMNHRCELVAVGNGKACRETEQYLSDLIQYGFFSPLDVQYTIVSEQGASIYSCSSEATKEFPNMDRNLISAVSLARRVQEPLSEMVKIEPKHLGVGMYQHDVPEKQLNTTLNEVVSECVSFVGVDINTASMPLLRRVAGLNESRASKILEWRESNGPYTNRQQLRLVKGIGEKTYEQAVGFIRVVPQSVNTSKLAKSEAKRQGAGVETCFNPLDRTWIHPESYAVAHRFMRKCGVELTHMGSEAFIRTVRETVTSIGLESLSQELKSSGAVIHLISEALQKRPDDDFRSEFSKPLFHRGVTSLEDLRVGTVLSGRVQNVTHFGSFVDIGVGRDGLIPMSKMKGMTPQFGDRVEVQVVQLEVERKRITLELLRML